ncbi:MAG TPA: hypothetical protein VGM98_07430, partial [Schlesneria sp.]
NRVSSGTDNNLIESHGNISYANTPLFLERIGWREDILPTKTLRIGESCRSAGDCDGCAGCAASK